MNFTIRDLLLVTVIVALAVAALLAQIDRQRLVKENGELRSNINRLNGMLELSPAP